MIREVVSDEEIGDIVSQWTGIPVSKLVETEREKLLNLSDILHERVVGQDKAVDLCVRCCSESACRYKRS